MDRNTQYLTCDGGLPNGQGDGYIARSPDGLIYRFNQMITDGYSAISRPRGGTDGGVYTVSRQRVRLYPGSVEDRYGNVVTYAWSGGKLTSISSNETSGARTLTLTYAGPNGVLSSVSDGTRTWNYGYQTYGGGAYSFLTSVTLPDGSAWTLGFQGISRGQVLYEAIPPGASGPTGYDTSLNCNWMRKFGNNNKTVTLTHPSGASASFAFNVTRHGRTFVDLNCNETVGNDERTHFPDVPARFDTWSIMSKTVSGPGLPTNTWSYTYSLPIGSYTGGNCPPNPPNICSTTKSVTLTEPDGSYTTNTYGIDWQTNDGQFLSSATYAAGGTLMSRTDNIYVDDAGAAQGPFAPIIGQTPQMMADSWRAELVRPLRKRTLVQDSTTFTHDITAFDTYARPAAVTKSATPGSTKTEITTYHNNIVKWVVGQVSTVSVGGVVVSQTDYDPTYARPTAVWQFGKKQYDLAYHASGPSLGNVYTVKDEKNQTTKLTDYFRGIARRVDYADTRFQAATVNALGLITSIQNEAGFITNYQYYPHGRLQKITYPGADTVVWNTRDFVFEKVPSLEYGLPANHWRQTVSQGNARTITYYDALWRPLLTRTFDAADEANTRRMVLSKFDHAGRTTFASYPQRTITGITSTPNGATTSYDALGRVKQTLTASELGTLTSKVEYLPGFKKKVTSPRGYATTISYQVFDAPSEDAPTKFEEPLGTTTTINRNVYGLPTSMVRSGTYLGTPLSLTRSYVYDTNKRLCKTIEPETGSTIIAYDLASNVAWRAGGQTLASTTDCQQSSVGASAKVTYTYDTRNRLTNSAFGDGTTPAISTTYTADGLPWTTTTDGSVWTYLYNKRRLLESETLVIDGAGASTYAIGHAYNPNGHEYSLSYPDATSVVYSPNALGEPTQVGSYATTFNRHPNGGIASFIYGNGIAHLTTQTMRGLPDLSSDAGGTATVINDDYNWDENGNVLRIINGIAGANSTRTMTYDARDRLASTTFDDIAAPVTFTYDPLDNLRTYFTPYRIYTHQYDSATWRLTAIANATPATLYTYSYAGAAGARGNVTTRAKFSLPAVTHSYTFDQANRLRQLAGPTPQTYRYDGLGRRTRLTSGGVPRDQVYSQAGQLLYDKVGATGSQTRTRYLYLGRHLVAKGVKPPSGAEVITYLHTDGLGSPIAETNTAGAMLTPTRTLHEPYGLVVWGTVNQGPGYTGHVTDVASGLNYMQQRYYDPVAGRFLSVDPVEANASTGASFNRYAYANNNPYKFVDPDGRCPVTTGSHLCIESQTFDPSRSSGKNAEGTSEMDKAVKDGKGAVKTRPGAKEERLGSLNRQADGGLKVQRIGNATTGSRDSADTASGAPPGNAEAIVHGHRTRSVADDPNSRGDSDAVKILMRPNYAVAQDGRVMVHEVLNGKYQVRMVDGEMTDAEVKHYQREVEQRQEFFYGQ